MYAELLHLFTLHHLRKVQGSRTFRQTEARVTICRFSVDSFSSYPLFPSPSCALQTPSHTVWSPRPLSGSLSPQYHSAELVACKVGGLLPPAVDVPVTPPPQTHTNVVNIPLQYTNPLPEEGLLVKEPTLALLFYA